MSGDLERLSFAIIEGSAGIRAAEHAKMFVTANWTDAMRSARAALSELRKPSEEAVLRALDHGPIGCCNLSDQDVTAIWRLMIDAMLEVSHVG